MKPCVASIALSLCLSPYAESMRQALGQGGSNFVSQFLPQEAIIASQQKAYRAKLRQVAEEHPEFLEALIGFSEVRQRYEEATRTADE